MDRIFLCALLGVFLWVNPVISAENNLFWGFFGHRLINRMAVFRLPPEMFPFFRKNIYTLTMEAVKADQRRHVVENEASMHYIDMDAYDPAILLKWQQNHLYFDSIPHELWQAHGALPHRIVQYANRLTYAFVEKDSESILRLSADLGHYIADAHVPLHTSENYDGQLTAQEGIHALWESRLPELFAATYDFSGRSAMYIQDIPSQVWQVVHDSHQAVDSVLLMEKEVSNRYKGNIRAYDARNKGIILQYSREFAQAYHRKLNDMVERRMRSAIHTTADIWFTCWVDAGQPDLSDLGTTMLQDSLLERRVRHARNAVHD